MIAAFRWESTILEGERPMLGSLWMSRINRGGKITRLYSRRHQSSATEQKQRNYNPTLKHNSHSNVIWSAVPSALQVVQNDIVSCYGAAAPNGPMTYGTTLGDSESPFLTQIVSKASQRAWVASQRVWKPALGSVGSWGSGGQPW